MELENDRRVAIPSLTERPTDSPMAKSSSKVKLMRAMDRQAFVHNLRKKIEKVQLLM